ncbi:MAG: ATP-binding protein [Gemmatimonadaceae bacterium]
MRLGLPGASQRRALALVPAILVMLIGALAYQRARTVVLEADEVERSHEMLEGAEALLTRMLDAETGQRAYLLVGDTTFLDPYRNARHDIGTQIARLRKIGERDSAQIRRLTSIERILGERFSFMDSTIRQREAGRFDPVRSAPILLAGKRKMDELRSGIEALHQHEGQLLAERHLSEQRSVRRASLAIALAAIAAIILSALINLAFARALAERDAANIELQQVNEDLERQSEQLEMQATEMESQAAELEATTDDLRSTNDELNQAARAAEEARDSAEAARAQLSRVLENLPDAAAAYDDEWRWTYMNPKSQTFLRELGKEPAELIGKVIWEEEPQLEGTRFKFGSLQAQRERKVVQVEEYFPTLDIWFERTIVPVAGGMMIFSRDITRQKREQEGSRLLSEASRVLASTLDYEKTLDAVARLAVGDLADWCGVDLLDAHGQIRQVIVAHIDEEKIKWARELNKKYPPDYSGPTGVGHVIRTGEPEIYREVSDEMLVAGARNTEHLKIMRELQFKSVLIVPMIARGRTLGALTLVSTEKGRRYGDADLILAMELATRAALAIDNSQLYRSALAASEAKSAFLATMSHELRTPLNAIIGYQSLLKEGIGGVLNESQLGHLARIRASADHLLGLIDEVLTFSRVEAGKEVIRREPTQLRPIIDEAITMVTPLARAKDLKLRVEGEDAQLHTDSGKVRQILLNLLSNAIKFTDRGEITVRSHRNGQSMAVSIVDTGIGIASDNLERIFDPFWQVEQRSTRKVGGTGLGLSVSRSLARLLGGEVTVESELDRGSTFTLTLPIRKR